MPFSPGHVEVPGVTKRSGSPNSDSMILRGATLESWAAIVSICVLTVALEPLASRQTFAGRQLR